MTAGPRTSASGERHIIARGIEAEGRDAALRLGSREPGAAIAARAQNLGLPPLRIVALCSAETNDGGINSRRIRSFLNADDE